jgi:tetratricopeptide (TPR) repeat protein
VRAELRTLPPVLADTVARRLAAAAADADADAERAYQHALAARRLAARVGVVRETCGIAAYRAGRWADALAELRSATRLTGSASYLAIMADCERALGRLDRALDLVHQGRSRHLDPSADIELRIVESGIRRDQGLPAAAVAVLQAPQLTASHKTAAAARLYYAYADALADAGREDEAREWFRKAAEADTAGETDAAGRFEELDMIGIDDLEGEPPAPQRREGARWAG